MRIYAETFLEVLTMELERREYLQKLITKKDNGRVKIVTGILCAPQLKPSNRTLRFFS